MELGRLKQLHPERSERRLCELLGINRSTVWRKKTGKTAKVIDLAKAKREKELTARIHALVKTHPSWGYRRIWAWLRHRDKLLINKKRVRRIMRENNWQARKIIRTPRPRVQERKSVSSQPNERWAIDATSLWSEEDGWIGVMAVIDCCTREIVGFDIAKRGRAVEAERALEQGCLEQFGLVYPKGEARPMLRSDNGKVFTSKRFVARCKQYGLEQEFTTPYSPQQNGMIERFFRSLKEECVWLYNFKTFKEAKETISTWIDFYNNQRPHQALGYLSPAERRAQYQLNVA